MPVNYVTILTNLSHSMSSFENMLYALAYVLGIMMIINGFFRFKKHSTTGGNNPFSQDYIVAATTVLMGSLLIYLPSSMNSFTTTFFGQDNILSYPTAGQSDSEQLIQALKFILKATGTLWFIRGAVLVVQSVEPGHQHGKKGLAFMFAGICATNIDYTVNALNYFSTQLFTYFHF